MKGARLKRALLVLDVEAWAPTIVRLNLAIFRRNNVRSIPRKYNDSVAIRMNDGIPLLATGLVDGIRFLDARPRLDDLACLAH
jgi:hypothetical protein